MDRKPEIRNVIRERRAGLSPDWVRAASVRVQERVLALPCMQAARKVACYLALPNEVQTDLLVAWCWDTGRQLCVPARKAGLAGYRWVRYERDTALAAGPLAIPQPEGVGATMEEPDVFLIPALAFDRRGGRVGHGGGHYDRLLAQDEAGRRARRGVRVGLAFAFQLCEAVPAGPHDVRMDWVVTEDESVPCGVPAGDRERGRT